MAVIASLQGGDNGTSDYSHGMGFINMFGWDASSYFDYRGNQRTYIGNVINEPDRGDTILFLNDTSVIRSVWAYVTLLWHFMDVIMIGSV